MPTATPSTLTVSTRRGPITFTTSLEWVEAMVELARIAETGNEFALSLLMREKNNKYMSQAQVSWVYKLAQDALDEREMDGKIAKLEVRSIDASAILGSLVEAKTKGIGRPILRLMRHNGVELKVKYMSTGRNAGGAWVTQSVDGGESELVGKIDANGVFTFVAKGYTDSLIDEVFDVIGSANNDPKAALQAYGKMTSRCGCCGRELTNEQSIALGIGPICLDRYGL